MRRATGIRLIAVVVAVGVIVAAALIVKKVIADHSSKRSDPVPDEDAYGAYYDDSENKAITRAVNNGTNLITVYYVRTENLRNVSVSSRNDSYGTYDVYEDEEGTEYLFLYNANLLCGMRKSSVGSQTRENAIDESQAIAIAEEWIRSKKRNGNDYVFDTCVYEESGGYYDIMFYLPIEGYKSDEIVRLWIDLQGNINAYSDFNQNRYGMVSVTPEKLAEAQRKLMDLLETKYADSGKEVEVNSTYVSKNDAGETVLVMMVVIKEPDEGIMYGELFEQPIE